MPHLFGAAAWKWPNSRSGRSPDLFPARSRPNRNGTNSHLSRNRLKIPVWSVHEPIRRVTIRPTVAGEIACFRRGRNSLPGPGNWANTAVFTMLDHVLLHALPVPDPDE